MLRLRKVVLLGLFFLLFGLFVDAGFVRADGDHGHAEEKMNMQEKMNPEKKMKMDMKMQMEKEMHHHSSKKKDDGPKLPPGTKEVKIDLSGPFCHKHPEEITAGLMKLAGVIHIEAFSGRRYILVHFNGDKVKPPEMAATIDGLKGSGWRCKGTVSTKKRTER